MKPPEKEEPPPGEPSEGRKPEPAAKVSSFVPQSKPIVDPVEQALSHALDAVLCAIETYLESRYDHPRNP